MEYIEIRKVGMALNNKIISAYEIKDDLRYAADLLGFWDENNQIMILEDESFSDFLFEYLIFEFNKKRVRLLDRFYNDKINRNNLTSNEIEILEGYYYSNLSFFEIYDWDISKSEVILIDLLDYDNYIRIKDVGLSKSIFEPFLLFARIIPIGDINILTGTAFPFKIELKNKILNMISMLKLKKNKVLNSTDLFILANQLYKEFGIPFATEEVS